MGRTGIRFRAADATEVPELAALWHEGWQAGHAGIVPGALAAIRTLADFRTRLEADLARVRVAEADGALRGFTMLKPPELYQFYVAQTARGTGLAALMMADAEAQLAGQGVQTAWLACSIGNDRAARFYEKTGWHRDGVQRIGVSGAGGRPFDLDVWIYRKRIG